jgi:hypothetical protein
LQVNTLIFGNPENSGLITKLWLPISRLFTSILPDEWIAIASLQLREGNSDTLFSQAAP